MKQLSFFKNKTVINGEHKSCAFTGHRVLGEDFSARNLKKEVEKFILSGVDTFYNGMAMGFDMVAAEIVLSLKKKYNYIKLIACIPCLNQEKYFDSAHKEKYANLLKQADEQVLLSENDHPGCMQKRDRYMVDHADYLMTYCRKEDGGTAYTVKYFIKTKNEENIIYL